MKMKITGNSARNLNKAALNSGRATKNARKVLNSSVTGINKYYTKVTNEQLANTLGCDVADITDWNTRIAENGYGTVVGHYVAKPEYFEALSDNNIEALDILDDGTIGYATGFAGGLGVKFYDITDDEIERSLNSCGANCNRKSVNSGRATRRTMNASRKPAARRQLNSNHNATRRPAINAAARRPLAPVLNSSARRTPATDARNYKLNSGLRSVKRLNSSASEVKLPSVWDKYYDITSDSKVAAKRAGIDVADIVDWDKEIENSGYGKVIGYLSAKPEYAEFLDELGELNVLDNGTVGYGISGERGLRFYSVSINEVKDLINKATGTNVASSRKLNNKKLNSNRSAILKELEDWFDKDEAVEYLDSFEDQTGATATKLATDEEVDKYDGVFWATKNGKESLWCLHNGMWVEKDLDSAKKLNSAEGEATEESETTSEKPAEETSEETTSEEEIDVTELLIVQEPESKELSLFIPDTPEEAVPEDVEVIATVETATAEDLDSSCGGKKKLNSSEEDGAEAATEDEAKEDEAKESESTEAEEEAVIELPDGETVEVEDIFVVQTDDGEYDLFIAEEDAELPEDVEVVGEAVAVDEDEVLNSSRQVKKAMAKLNSSKKTVKKAKKATK